MEISEKLREQKDKVERLFVEADLAQREFIRMADAEGLPERQIRRRWLVLVEWGMKELSAESWKVTLSENLGDDGPQEPRKSPEQVAEEMMKEIGPDNVAEAAKEFMVEVDKRLKQKMNEFARLCARQGMSETEIRQTIAKALGQEMPDAGDDDPFADNTLE